MKETLDILWIILCSGLVLLMQGGFLCLETGLTRSKNSINVALKNAMDLAVAILVFWAFGYGLMFGASEAGWIGSDRFFGGESTPRDSSVLLFQALFCGTAVTIVSGAVAERLRFSMYLVISLMIAGLIYPLIGHWAWNGIDLGAPAGWLGTLGFVDWAGSTVVHSTGGWIALALLIVIGPRKGRFGEDGTVSSVTGSNLPLVALGALLLWFGWIGFNGGSTLELTSDIGPIIFNTCLAAAAGAMSGLFVTWMTCGRAEFLPPLNGLLAGLVAITAAAHAVGPGEAIIIGGIGGICAVYAERALLAVKIDDAVGAVPVHVAGGVWGTLAVGFFGDPEKLGTGLSWGAQIVVQAQGVLVCAVVAFALPLAVLWGLSRVFALRVSDEAEDIGLNVSEHGARTELFEFVSTMNDQAETGDLSLRVPADPFTEIGQIGGRYNQVMDVLEAAVAKTEAVVKTSNDAIIMFEIGSGRIVFHNPKAEEIFAQPVIDLGGMAINDLLPDLDYWQAECDAVFETAGVLPDGNRFPVDVIVSSADFRTAELMIATVRDISERKEAEAAMVASEKRFRTVFQSSAIGMVVLDRSGRIVDSNPSFAKTFRSSTDALRDVPMTRLSHPDDMAMLADGIGFVACGDGDHWTRELRFRCIGEEVLLWARVALTTAPDAMGERRMIIAMVEDITEHRTTTQALRLSASVFESTQENIVIFDPGGRIERANRAFNEASGYSEKEAKGLDLSYILSARYTRDFFDEIHRELAEKASWQGEVLLRRKSEELMPAWLSLSEVRGEDGKTQNCIGIFTDLTERKDKEAAIWRHANFDLLTGLGNRRLFNHRLSLSLKQAERREKQVALLFLDLDGFKGVNDSLGHKAGDELLQQVSERLQAALRSTDMVARLGGDEFTVILEDFERLDDVTRIAGALVRKAAAPYELSDGVGNVSASIGIAVFPRDAGNLDDLIKNADAALYHAKESGKNTYKFFTPELNAQLLKRVQLEKEIRDALDAGRIMVYYQPQISLKTGRVHGAEALVRMLDNDGGLVSPADFIPFAEETGLISSIGRQVMERVGLDVKAWSGFGLGDITISINVSPKQFRGSVSLADQLAELMDRMSIPLGSIVVEITEGSLMADRQATIDQLTDLDANGIAISLDDFGTGYSSLSRLKRLPIKELKIDRAFIAGIPQDDRDVAMVTAMINMTRGLGIEVVAEGVETVEQEQLLKSLGCEMVQGYYYAKPMEPLAFIEFAQEWNGVASGDTAEAEAGSGEITLPAGAVLSLSRT